MLKNQAKTVNGSPTSRSSLNIESPSALKNARSGPLARVALFYRRLNEVMSGMYTGVGCVGTPHEHHRYDEQAKSKNPND